MADVERIRENARVLGAIHAKQGEAMSDQVLKLEARIVALRTRVAELSSEADGFVAAAQHELSRL